MPNNITTASQRNTRRPTKTRSDEPNSFQDGKARKTAVGLLVLTQRHPPTPSTEIEEPSIVIHASQIRILKGNVAPDQWTVNSQWSNAGPSTRLQRVRRKRIEAMDIFMRLSALTIHMFLLTWYISFSPE